jgi:hypothetical protein
MNEIKTSSILQRLPVVLAVTAASYGLNLGPAQAGTALDGKPRTSAQTQSQPLAKRNTTD